MDKLIILRVFHPGTFTKFTEMVEDLLKLEIVHRVICAGFLIYRQEKYFKIKSLDNGHSLRKSKSY